MSDLSPAEASWHDWPNSYRHRTKDLWEAAALNSRGWPIATAAAEDGEVTFTFPDGGSSLLEDVQAIRRGESKLNVMALKQSYYELRRAVTKTLSNAARTR